MPRGGRRTGAGRPKGSREPHTLAKEAAKEAVRVQVTAALEPIVRAHIAQACGIGHLYERDEDGKFKRITDAAQIDALLAEGIDDTKVWIFAKDPDTRSLKELLDRALDRPKEHHQVEHKVTLEDLVAGAGGKEE